MGLLYFLQRRLSKAWAIDLFAFGFVPTDLKDGVHPGKEAAKGIEKGNDEQRPTGIDIVIGGVVGRIFFLIHVYDVEKEEKNAKEQS